MVYAAAKLVWLSNLGSWVAFDARLIKLIWVDGRVILVCSSEYSLLKIALGSFDNSWVGRVLVFYVEGGVLVFWAELLWFDCMLAMQIVHCGDANEAKQLNCVYVNV